MLPVRQLQTGEDSRVVLVHGFTQSGGVWASIAEGMSGEVLAVDLPGHGEADPKYDGADPHEAARLLVEAGGPGIYVGYSLGARVVLRALLDQHAEVEQAVLIGAKAGYQSSADAKRRQQADDVLADRIELDGVNGFIDEWMRQPFNQRIAPDQQFVALRKANRPEGLANSLRRCGSGQHLFDAGGLGRVDVPVTLLYGDEDLPHVIDDNRLLESALPGAKRLMMVNSGHAWPWEHPTRLRQFV